MTDKTHKRAVIYARYSTDNQSKASVADQIRLCERLCDEQGWTVAGIYSDDAQSGFNHLRSDYQRMLSFVEGGGCDVIVAESYERLIRDGEHSARLYKRMTYLGIPIVTSKGGRITEIDVGLSSLVSEMTRKLIADKTHRGLEGRVIAGKSAGGISYGYRLDRQLRPDGSFTTGDRVIDPDEAAPAGRSGGPHLQIIEDDLWEKVRARQGALKSKDTAVPVWDRRRPKTLFSGLMKCGCCGSGFSKVTKDSFGCSAARNKGRAVCTNMALIKQADLEARVLDALAHHLMDPEAVAVFCEAYTAERNRLAATATNTRAEIERKLAKVKHDHAKLVDAIIAGVPADQVKDKMIALDDQRVRIEAKLAAAQVSPAPLRFHPKMAETYRDRVGTLIRKRSLRITWLSA